MPWGELLLLHVMCPAAAAAAAGDAGVALAHHRPVRQRSAVPRPHSLHPCPTKTQTRWLVSKTLGLAGIQALDRATEVCCERSNPTLQIGYLIIWSVGYGLYWEHVFKLLPNLYAAEWHM